MGFDRYQGRVALVTGGGSGIGAAIAQRFAAEGASVIVAGRDHEKLERTAGQAPESGAIVARAVDVRNETAVIELVNTTVEQFDRLDIVVNCAGDTDIGFLTELNSQVWQEIIAVNASAVLYLAKAALPHLRRSKGNIVTIGSSNVLRNNYGQPAYGAAKSAADSLTASIAIEYGADGVRSNVVHPGVIYPTGMTSPMTEMPGALNAYASHIPARRTGTPEEVAAVVAFLASSEASYVNGAIVTVDGGLNQVLHLPPTVPPPDLASGETH